MTIRPPKTLYHYCSVATFYNIIKNRSIWLSDISKSNDSLELRWIKGQCKLYILKAWVEYVKSLENYEQTLKLADFDRFKQLEDQLEYLFNLDMNKCWVFCLSGKKDDLGQWRGYADDGLGISIGFKPSYFSRIIRTGKTAGINEHSVTFDRVIYNEKKTERLFYDLNFGNLSSITPQMNSSEVLEELNNTIIMSLLHAPFFKNVKFEEEKEWRLVFNTIKSELYEGKNPSEEFGKFFPNDRIQFEFSVRGNNLVSHLDYHDDNLAKGISEIWIGPKCKVSPEDIKLFLISTGFLSSINDDAIKVHKSQASYR